MQEKQFEKYKTRGADYHWKEINLFNPARLNLFLLARYEIVAKAIEKAAHQLEKQFSRVNNIVDFGCGDGVQLYFLQKILSKKDNKIDLFGIDLSREAVNAAQNKLPGANISVASIYESQFSDDQFDIVYSSDVIEHVQYPNKMIDEMIRVTRPSGFILVATPIRYMEDPVDSMHVQEFFPREFLNLFKERKNIEIIHICYSHPLEYKITYSRTIRFFGIPVGLNKYIFNLLFLFFKHNPFCITLTELDQQCPMTYQYILIKKLSQ